MSYTVEWTDDAEQDLADIWINAPDQKAISSAADELDRQLARDPLSDSESREGAERIAFVIPLAIRFTVDSGRRRVVVTAVWRIR